MRATRVHPRAARALAALTVGSAAILIAGACTGRGGASGGPWRPTTTAMDHGAGGMDHGHGGMGGMDHSIPARLDHDPTPAQIRTAIKLVEDTKAATRRYATTREAVAAGYRDIGDRQHYTNATYREDGRELDPQRIESLVYDPFTGRLQAAMYNMEPGTTLDNVVDIAGNWTIYHNHNNLCWKNNIKGTPGYTELGGVVVNGRCTGTSVLHEPVLMIHVWVVPNACGPFATLPGLGEGSCLPNFPNP